VMPDELEQAIQRLRIVEAALQDQHSANVRREAAIIEEMAREVRRALEPDFAWEREPRFIEERMDRREPEYRVREHGRRRRERRRSRW
jgi:hypothetical protein